MLCLFKNKAVIRITASFLAISLITQILTPTVAYALTAGPGSPEFSSFEPVATTDMVNLQSGEFNYNLPVLDIPGPDGAGYALSLSYHSGASLEEEASWVGFGWSLNPGAINRSVRGFPDDYKATPIKQYNKRRSNWSSSITKAAGLEIASKDDSKSSIGSLNYSNTLRFNNYQGYSASRGFGIGAKGLVNLNMEVGAQGPTFSAGINIASLFQQGSNAEKSTKDETKRKVQFDTKAILKKYASRRSQGINKLLGSLYGLHDLSEPSFNTGVTRSEGISINWSQGLVLTGIPMVGPQFGKNGNLNIHKSIEGEDLRAYGFLNNYAQNAEGEARIADYYIERDSPFKKTNFYLGIPFSNPDQFFVTGEGLGGGFRYFPASVGHYYPNYVSNSTPIIQLGSELTLGTSVGVSAKFGAGFQKTKMTNWAKAGNSKDYLFDESKAGYFRFNNDLGGSISYDKDPTSLKTAITQDDFLPVPEVPVVVPGTRVVKPVISADLSKELIQDEVKASSDIKYNTLSASADYTKRFNKRVNQKELTYHTAYHTSSSNTNTNSNGIAEISIVNESGSNYIYGLPVFNRKEASLQVDAKSQAAKDGYLAYQPLHLNSEAEVDVREHELITGQIKKVPYASTYLITQILTPDYIDRNNNGPDKDDFGGWTQFHYHKKWGGDNNWYRWRTPYNGLIYSKNTISDTKDDIGAVSTGEKEVYYLQAIETKTHIAFFVTNDTTNFDAKCSPVLDSLDTSFRSGFNKSAIRGSGSKRKDGLGAARLTSTDPAAEAAGVKDASQQLEYLEKIVLYSKARPERPLKTIHFAYDYSLVKGLPNSTEASDAENSGKLTLKKVWTEYEGVIHSKTSPFEFSYFYKQKEEFPQYIRDKYEGLIESFTKYSSLAQNPSYNPHALDPWGNLQVYGAERKKHQIPWVYQGPLPATRITNQTSWVPRTTGDEHTEFDPAAWQLKQIKLPSGGEILIEYEQKDYTHVQNRPAMAMASLLNADEVVGTERYKVNPSYVINTRDLGLDPDDADTLRYQKQLEEQAKLISSYLKENKAYFKFLYGFRGKGVPSLDDCNSEYITGYAQAKTDSVEVVTVSVNDKKEKHLKIILTGADNKERTEVPRQACYDFYTTQRMGKDGVDCKSNLEINYDEQINSYASTIIKNPLTRFDLIAGIMKSMEESYESSFNTIPDKMLVGNGINLGLSYIKLPMLKPKKGGGIRVKRLLMYDPGIEADDAALYGQEFLYHRLQKLDNGNYIVTSSGVATNEPTREENPLVGFLPQAGQSWYSRITAGEDKEQTEGPIGESLLPSPSISYSRVVVKNIHAGATGSGFAVTEYNTVREYPYDMLFNNSFNSELGADRTYTRAVDYSTLADNRKTDHLIIPAGIFYYETDKEWVAQGYRFITNSMHGQINRTATYAGSYDLKDYWTSYEEYEDKKVNAFPLVSEQKYEYFKPGEKIKFLQPNGKYTYGVPGREMDLAMEMKSVVESTMDLSVEVDVAMYLPAFPTVTVSAALFFSYNEKALNSHVTSKVLRYPAIIKKITARQDGVYSTVEHLAFNQLTGKPVLTRTSDGYELVLSASLNSRAVTYDGGIYSLNMPATWYYPAMGQKSIDASNLNMLNASAGEAVFYRLNPLRGEDKETNLQQGWNELSPRNVLKASVQTYSKDWFPAGTVDPTQVLLEENYSLAILSTEERAALNKIYRPLASYVFRDTVATANSSGKLIQNAGYNTDGYSLFSNWEKGSLGLNKQKWVLRDSVTKYSPYGNALEEQNALQIPSAARFGYNHLLPVVIAKNATYNSIYFESYESDLEATNGEAHSGAKYRQVSPAAEFRLVDGIQGDSRLAKDGALVKLWVKSCEPQSLQLSVNGSLEDTASLHRIACSGEWSLYEAHLKGNYFTASVGQALFIDLNHSSSAALAIDDIRFQPLTAQASCYVYDVKTLKLLAQFDDQHFGLFYQYNNEGRLVRKLIETERGVQTIQETQYNIPRR
jgi:hypothetical protein